MSIDLIGLSTVFFGSSHPPLHEDDPDVGPRARVCVCVYQKTHT